MCSIAFMLQVLCFPLPALGTRISPLHRHFPIRIRPEALAEAIELEQEMVSLV